MTFWDQQRDGTYLYRYYDGDGRLLYVGIASDVYKRFMQHSLNSPWFVDAVGVTVENFATRAEALAAETAAIAAEWPLWNQTGSFCGLAKQMTGPAPMEQLVMRCYRRNALRPKVECGRCRARLVRFATTPPLEAARAEVENLRARLEEWHHSAVWGTTSVATMVKDKRSLDAKLAAADRKLALLLRPVAEAGADDAG